MQYKAGQTYLMQVTLEVEVTPTKDCTDREMEQPTIAAVEREKDNLRNCLIEYQVVGQGSVSSCEDDEDDDNTEENAPVKLHNPEDAVKAWQDLFAQYDDAGSVINLNEVPQLSPHQTQFVQDALDADLPIRRYSGRGMYGRECPGVNVDDPISFKSDIHYSWDSMGRGFIVYVPR